MASQFQSQVLENGQWVTRTSNVNDVLSKPATKPAKQKQPPPQCGIMTRTLIESPVAHWILPVRLRSPQHNDIAIVGDHHVQISEFQDDLQLHSIAKKRDFGSRIRNAKVIGTFNRDDIDASRFQASRSHRQQHDDIDVGMSEISTAVTSSNPPQLPPQLLLIVLETGDCIFLFLRSTRDGSYEFSALQHELDATRLVRPGFHLAVDPSSRYVAQACSRDIFVVHELESMSNLNNSFINGQPLRPVKSSRPRAVNGTIQSMDFLYPRPQDPHHIILLLIVVDRGIPRMVTYDWELDDDVGEALAVEKMGHLLPRNHEMPLLIIPLTIRTAFFAVSEGEIAFCKDILYGSPTFEPCEIGSFAPSEHHDGSEPPLWTAWSRPPRLSRFHPNNDHIYVAREDGLVLFLECDSENILGAAFNHGTFCNVSTAFTSLSHHNDDILVFGGDSGLGGVWKASFSSRAPPREQVVRLSQIPNWSPTVDFVTTNESRRWDDHSGATGKTRAGSEKDQEALSPVFFKPDRVFAAAGRGRNGSIVEYRRGLRANIGIDFDFGTVVKRCFMLPANVSEPDYGHHLLLSLPGRSALLRFDSDFSTTFDVDPDETPYDISSPTLMAKRVSEDFIVQVTESGIVLINSSASKHFSFSILGLGGAAVTDATIQENILAVTSHSENVFELHTILLDGPTLEARYLHREAFKGEVTCLGLCNIAGKPYAVASLWWNSAIYLDLFSIQDKEHIKIFPVHSLAESLLPDDFQRGMFNVIEPFTSIVPVLDEPGNSVLIAGSRDGALLTLGLDDNCEVASVSLERVGSVPAYVYEASHGSAFVCCESSFTQIGDFQGGKRGFAKKQSVWTVDANDSSKLAPSITSVVVLQESLSGSVANTPLLLLATDHVLLAELQPEVGPVQRQIPLGMTPQKLLYSHVLKCLVVGVRTLDDRPTLRFIDPDTGEDLSLPLHGHTREPADFISGLGKTGDRILCLDEWHIESKNKNFYFILVGTNGGPSDGGRVLIVSPQIERPAQGESRGRISFWTRHRIKGPREPVYAVTAAGRKIQAAFHSELVYYRLDEGEKKLTQVSTKQLDSEAWKLSVLPSSPHTLALTRRDSLWVLEEAENAADGFEVRHVDPYTPHGLDMLEVAGNWPPPLQSSEPPPSIVLIADQECGLNGLWIPWDSPDQDCEVLFETDLPSTVRRLRLGRTLPSWSREARSRNGSKRFGLLAASAGDGEVLGMGIDGSLQHFTLLDFGAWRFLRFLQNVSETSAELYPFTHMQFESAADEEAFDPRPSAADRETLERQVDGDLMQRILDRRALEGLVWSRPEWAGYFMEYLDGVDGGRWTRFEGLAGEEERSRAYVRLAYEILEYFLVPII